MRHVPRGALVILILLGTFVVVAQHAQDASAGRQPDHVVAVTQALGKAHTEKPDDEWLSDGLPDLFGKFLARSGGDRPVFGIRREVLDDLPGPQPESISAIQILRSKAYFAVGAGAMIRELALNVNVRGPSHISGRTHGGVVAPAADSPVERCAR